MFSLLKRYRDVLIVGALLLYPLITYLSSGHRGRDPNFVDAGVRAVSSPIQSGLTWVVRTVGSGISGYLALRGAHEEAQRCRAQLAETKAELHGLGQAAGENARLKALLGYVEGTLEPEVPARVIGLASSPHFLSLRLNRGQADGIRPGMPVVTADGVVGQVNVSAGGVADVMLVSDSSSRLGVTIVRSRVRATVVGAGDGNSLLLENVGRDQDVVDGDEVITSGTDGVFPKGLKVGRVEGLKRAAPTAMFLSARVAPAVNLRRVEEVLVVPSPLSSQGSALLPVERPR